MVEITLIGLGLAVDCVAVAAATGVAVARVRPVDGLKMATIFGGMQAALGAIGWLGGEALVRVIAAWDHWVAFALLAFVGGRMIREGLEPDDEEEKGASSFALPRLLLLGVAVSIDSAAVGITLPVMAVPVGLALGTIGAASFLLTLLALAAADRLSGRFAGRMEVIGGIVLIAIGVRVLAEHLFGG